MCTISGVVEQLLAGELNSKVNNLIPLTKKEIVMGKKLGQVGNNFAADIKAIGVKTTAYYRFVAMFVAVLHIIDVYMLSLLPLEKPKLIHLINDDTTGSTIVLTETINVEEVDEEIHAYLRQGKEMILSRLQNLADYGNFCILWQEITAHANKTESIISAKLTHMDFPILTISDIDLMRTLHDVWSIYNKCRASVDITLASVKGNPQVIFGAEPPFENWITTIDQEVLTGFFRLVSTNFEDNKKWRARIINSSETRPVLVNMIAPSFLDGLQSSRGNGGNGLLIGDILKAKYRIVDDVLNRKKIYEIISVEEHKRADTVATQLPLFNVE